MGNRKNLKKIKNLQYCIKERKNEKIIIKKENPPSSNVKEKFKKDEAKKK